MAYFHSANKKGFNYSNDDSFVGVLERYELDQPIVKLGRICRELYKSQDSAFRIYQAEDKDGRSFVVTGQFPVPLILDGYYEFKGAIKAGTKGEKQISVESCHAAAPEDESGMISALAALPGLDILAPRIYEAFGIDSLNTIKNDPALVASSVPGVTKKQALQWQKCLLDAERSESGLDELLGFGLNRTQAGVLLEEYGSGVVERVRDDPYFLLTEFPTFSFKKCDLLALKNGGAVNAPSRMVQAMVSVMKKEALINDRGYLPKDELIDKALRLINMTLEVRTAERMVKSSPGEEISVSVGENHAILSKSKILETLKSRTPGSEFYFPIFNVSREEAEEALTLGLGTFIIDEDGDVALRRYSEAEDRIVRTVEKIMGFRGERYPNVQETIDTICQAEGITLENKQMEATRMICDSPGGVYILTGSAGCGKTFTLNIILKVLKKLSRSPYDFSAKILAPTGKAAKVAAKATGLPASTIHMAVGYTQDDTYTKDVQGDVVVIDEFSMVDLCLASALFSAISPMSKVIILGDTKQLPSIGPGTVLSDLIKSGAIPMVELDVVKRQSEGSGILENANKIVAGQAITSIKKGRRDLSGDAIVDTNGLSADKILNYIQAVSKVYSLDDIQVLCPQHGGPTGTDMLNYKIQHEFNPGEDTFLNKEIAGKQLCWRVGDKVIHTKNNYKAQWYQDFDGKLLEDYGHIGIINGETGKIWQIREKNNRKEIIVKYDDGFIRYRDDFSELEHAYAMTIHKSQGSQWPVVICPLADESIRMMDRKLLYTMYTRAQNTNVTVGSERALREGERDRGTISFGKLAEKLFGNRKQSVKSV